MAMPRCRFTYEFKLNALHEKRPAYQAANEFDIPGKTFCG